MDRRRFLEGGNSATEAFERIWAASDRANHHLPKSDTRYRRVQSYVENPEYHGECAGNHIR